MSKRSYNAAVALFSRQPFSGENTVVRDGAMYLYGTKIAWWVDGNTLAVTPHGWLTRTTRERLNAVMFRFATLFYGDARYSALYHGVFSFRVKTGEVRYHLDYNNAFMSLNPMDVLYLYSPTELPNG